MLTVLAAMVFILPPWQNERVEYAVTQMMSRGLSRSDAEALFQDRRLQLLPQQDVQPRTIDWDQVIAGLVAPASVKQGTDFIDQYRETLERVEQRTGVDRRVIAGLLRTESNFGRNTGRYGTFNVFYTLLSRQQEERRWRWAAENLAALAAFCKQAAADCFQVRGSYAGALGAAQFLPFSLLQFGADGNGDNRVDPFLMEDAIASAANFLVEHGWQQDQLAALGKYYGSTNGYPRAVFAYVEALKAAEPPASDEPSAAEPAASEAAAVSP
jgi:membrane-bound lytic murein transglycosylase B